MSFFRKWRSWSLPTRISIFLAIAIPLFLWAFDDSAKKSDTDQITNEIREQAGVLGENKRYEFSAKYPLGYSVFYSTFDDPMIVPARVRSGEHGVEIDWGSFRVDWSETRNGFISFVLPNVIDKVSGSRVVGCKYVMRWTPENNAREIDDVVGVTRLKMVIEILRSDSKGLIGVFGFRPRK